MTKRFALFLAAALVATAPTAIAQERLAGMRGMRHVLPAYEILTIIRSTGFEPVGHPVRRGRRYEVDAIDPYDADVRLIVNARTGRIVAVRHADDRGLGGPEFYGPRLPRENYAQNGPRWRRPAWSVNRSREPRLVPPRSIPASRSAALGPETTPLPRPRPGGQAVAATGGDDVEVTGSVGSVKPSGSKKTTGSTASTAPKTGSTASTTPKTGSTASTTPKTGSTASTAPKTSSVASTGPKKAPIDMVPVVPLF